VTSLTERVTLTFSDSLALQLHIALTADAWETNSKYMGGPYITRLATWHPTMYLPRVW